MEYRPWTWKAPESSSEMKRTITRQDAFERVRGHAVFSRDASLPGMLYAKILLSPYAHARIKRIDTSEAKTLVGVRDILTYDDPDIAFDNESGPIFEMSRNLHCLRQVGARLPHNSGQSSQSPRYNLSRGVLASLEDSKTRRHEGVSEFGF
jgi:hypothetical protein